ncbi:hypothetical protein S245_046995 [Arachis hypogaea]
MENTVELDRVRCACSLILGYSNTNAPSTITCLQGDSSNRLCFRVCCALGFPVQCVTRRLSCLSWKLVCKGLWKLKMSPMLLEVYYLIDIIMPSHSWELESQIFDPTGGAFYRKMERLLVICRI